MRQKPCNWHLCLHTMMNKKRNVQAYNFNEPRDECETLNNEILQFNYNAPHCGWQWKRDFNCESCHRRTLQSYIRIFPLLALVRRTRYVSVFQAIVGWKLTGYSMQPRDYPYHTVCLLHSILSGESEIPNAMGVKQLNLYHSGPRIQILASRLAFWSQELAS